MGDPTRSRLPQWVGDLRGASLAFVLEVIVVIVAVAIALVLASAALALF
jgi:hypothetical protein